MTSLVYSTGTVSVSNASAVVTGTSTAWLLALVTGGMFSFAGMSVPILSVESDTSLTLAYPWPGANGSGAYAIARETSEAVRAAWINDRLARLMTKPWGTGVVPDGRGTLAERDALNPMPTDKYCWLREETGFDPTLYFKTPSGWIGPYALAGEQGPAGVGVGGYGLPAGGTTGQVPTKASGTDGHVVWADPAGAAADIDFTPSGSIGATNVQDAIAELDAGLAIGRPLVIFATGQSNITVTPDLAWDPAPNVVKWDWEYGVEADVGTQFLPLDPTKINTSWKFASDLARDNPTRTVYLINIAWSAQSISHWKTGTGSPDVFQIILNNVPNALAATGVDHIDMMLWWQGESDAASPSNYTADFETVMNRFKAQSWFPIDTPVVIFGINNSANIGNANRDEFNALLQKCVYADPENRMFTYGPGSLPLSFWTSGSGYNDMTPQGYFVVGGIAYQNWASGTGRPVLRGLSTNYGTKAFELNGSFNLSGSETVAYVTPVLGAPVQTKIKMDTITLGGFSQLVAWGISAASAASSRILSLFDSRTVAHQPTLAVFSVDEVDLMGFSWEGNNAGGRAYLKTITSPIGFRINATDVGGFSTSGYLFVGLGAAAVQGVVGAYQMATVQGSDVSLANNITTAQSVLAAANDTLTVLAATTYRFRAKLYIATGTTTHTTAFGFGGTATLTSIRYQSKLWSGTSGTINSTAPSILDVASATSTVLNATSAAAFTIIELEGTIRVNAAGTLIPQITFSAGPTGTCAVKVDSFIELWPIGSNTISSIGNWS